MSTHHDSYLLLFSTAIEECKRLTKEEIIIFEFEFLGKYVHRY